MGNLNDKVIVVTGGNSGIGYAAAKELSAQGAKVIITGRNPEAVQKAAAELGVTGIVADQGKLDATDRLVKEVSEKFGKVDVLFINAGIGAFVPIEQATESHFDEIMDINFKGAYFTLSKFIPTLSDGGSVIFLSSIVANQSMAGASVYSASKAALNSIMKIAALELAPRGIRVNAISPGPIATNILGKAMPQEQVDEFVKILSEKSPLKRVGEAHEVAHLVTHLSGDNSKFTTGSEFVIDGGLLLV